MTVKNTIEPNQRSGIETTSMMLAATQCELSNNICLSGASVMCAAQAC